MISGSLTYEQNLHIETVDNLFEHIRKNIPHSEWKEIIYNSLEKVQFSIHQTIMNERNVAIKNGIKSEATLNEIMSSKTLGELINFLLAREINHKKEHDHKAETMRIMAGKELIQRGYWNIEEIYYKRINKNTKQPSEKIIDEILEIIELEKDESKLREIILTK